MQPQIIEDSIAVAANTVVENIIAANNSLRSLLRSPFPANGKILAIISATGLQISLDYGSKNVLAPSDLRVGTDLQDPFDVLNDDWYVNEGDMLILRANNTTGGAITLRYRIVLTPLAEPGQAVELPPDSRVMQRGPVAVAAGVVDQQLLDGLRYERPPVPSTLEVFMTASAAGLTRQLYVEQDRISPPTSIPPLNRVPQDPSDSVIDGIEVPEDKLIQLPVSNPTGGALNVFWRTKLTEIART